jgi:elongation factor 2
MLHSLGVVLTPEDLELRGKPLLQLVLHRWKPLHSAVLETLLVLIPSPKEAQVPVFTSFQKLGPFCMNKCSYA